MEFFPAVVIGGPPHSGKSVLDLWSHAGLTYARHRSLRAACLYSDGEGDWANEADQTFWCSASVSKGPRHAPMDRSDLSPDIARRHLPLIVDVGGKPTPDQERVFDVCTHAILLTPTVETQNEWQARVAEHGMPLLADLTSTLPAQSIDRAGTDRARRYHWIGSRPTGDRPCVRSIS